MNETTKLHTELTRDWIYPDWPAHKNVRAVVTTRSTSFFQNGYSGFNLAEHVGDDNEKVRRHRGQLTEQLNLPRKNLCWLQQVHGQQIVSADDVLKNPLYVPQADGCETSMTNLACIVMTADCLPVLLCNLEGTKVAAIHAGWRGLANGILNDAVNRFSHPQQVIAWLGPAISQKNFEVGADVFQTFCDASPLNKTAFIQKNATPNKWFADIYQLAKIQLQSAGVTQIYGGDFCTFDDQQRFYSYRRDGNKSGRMASIIYLT